MFMKNVFFGTFIFKKVVFSKMCVEMARTPSRGKLTNYILGHVLLRRSFVEHVFEMARTPSRGKFFRYDTI